MCKTKFNYLKLKQLIKFYFKNKTKYYISNIKKIIIFARKNYNFITYIKLYWFLPNCEINDLKKIIFILEKFNVKVYDKFPSINVFNLINRNKDIKIEENIKKKYFFKNLYLENIRNLKKLNDFEIIKYYKSIEKYLNKISKIINKNFYIFKYIFFEKNNNYKIKNFLNNFLKYKYFLKNDIFKYSFSESDEINAEKFKLKKNFISKKIIKKFFEVNLIKFKFFLSLNLSLKYIFFLYKNSINFNKTFDFYYFVELNNLYNNLNFRFKKIKFNIINLTINILNICQKKNYKYFFKKNHKKIINKIIKNKLYNFKINWDILESICLKLDGIIKIIENIKIKIFDVLCNLCNITYIKFTFLFLSNGSDLNWVLNMSNFSNLNEDFIKNYKIFLKKKQNVLKKIELKFSVSIKNIFNIFYDIKMNKFKIDIIRDILIKSNLYLVNQIARKHFDKNIHLDCIQEGNLSVIKFISIYNYKSKLNFKELINLIIRQSISKFLYKNNKLLRFPSYIITMLRKINKIFYKYLKENKEEPSINYISRQLNVSEERLRKVLLLTKNPVSYERFINDSDTLLGDLIGDFREKKPDKDIYKNQLKKTFNKIVLNLDNELLKILKLRYGLYGYKKHTLSEIGEKIGVTRERVRQIQNIILNKLKYPKKFGCLKNFFIPRNKL